MATLSRFLIVEKSNASITLSSLTANEANTAAFPCYMDPKNKPLIF